MTPPQRLVETNNADASQMSMTVLWEDLANGSPKGNGIPIRRFSSYPQAQEGLSATEELNQAIATCKAKVERIAKACRDGNRKFRDIEFDLEKDQEMCLYGLEREASDEPTIGDVRRISEILENPKFFAGEPHSSDIIQGACLGDCWFLSALSCVACSPGLLKKICVARDKEVGVYGFVFFKDTRWVDVIVDDQLCCSLPKFEGLSRQEQEVYHHDKDLYNEVARKRGQGLTYAHSGTAGETWVPLIEKAYAKLHGDYASLDGGMTCDAIEDLTGGISVTFNINDILDPDVFWNEQLLYANKRPMFGVGFDGKSDGSDSDSEDSDSDSDSEDSGKVINADARPTGRANNGLMGSHAYAILRAKECDGKRFIVIRNPWGSTEWNGAWSDGSQEWTEDVEKGIKILNELDHVLGDDGQFVMEYSDFLDTWQDISRTTIFDENWIMSTHWLCVPPRPVEHCWTFGEVVYYLSVPEPSQSVISLSRLDGRNFSDLGGSSMNYNFDFVVFNLETKEKVGESYNGSFWLRGTTCEVYLDKGVYAVYPRIDRSLAYPSGYVEALLDDWNERKLSRVLMQRTRSRSIALNYELGKREKFIPISVKDLIESENESEGSENSASELGDADILGFPKFTTTTTNKTFKPGGRRMVAPTPKSGSNIIIDAADSVSNDSSDDTSESGSEALKPSRTKEEIQRSVTFDDEDEHSLFLSLRVYTKKGCVVQITGNLPEMSEEDEEVEEDEDEAVWEDVDDEE